MNKIFCAAGMIAAGLLAIIDFATSYMGIQTLLPEGNESPILAICPFICATLALSINALSSYLLKMFAVKEFTSFSKAFLVTCFLGFLVYDGVSSYLGLLAHFSGQSITSLQGVFAAVRSLEPAQAILAAVIATLASFSPLLTSVFFDLWKEAGGLGMFDAVSGQRRRSGNAREAA